MKRENKAVDTQETSSLASSGEEAAAEANSADLDF